jgi:hypothetical protein
MRRAQHTSITSLLLTCKRIQTFEIRATRACTPRSPTEEKGTPEVHGKRFNAIENAERKRIEETVWVSRGNTLHTYFLLPSSLCPPLTVNGSHLRRKLMRRLLLLVWCILARTCPFLPLHHMSCRTACHPSSRRWNEGQQQQTSADNK